MKLIGAFFVTAIVCLAAPKVELGDLKGAKFRIDIPESWNGGLVVYCHGYADKPVNYTDGPLPAALAVFTSQGYAVAQSGYSAGGWAIEQAVSDIEALRQYFVLKYGRPKETFITGHSMGGFLTMMLMERAPANYDAGLAMCGPLAPAAYFMQAAFDLRVVTDYYFPGMLPAPDRVPASFQGTPELDRKLQALFESQPEKSAALLRFAGLHNTQELARVLTFLTYVLMDMEQRAGGNPFDNRNTIYETQNDYNALNEAVKRYTADFRAAEYMRTWYTPTGRLTKPMLAIHTTYDPIVPVRIANRYSELVQQSGSSGLFVQQFVEHDGHCAIQPAEIAAGFSELRTWKSNRTKPQAGLLREKTTLAAGERQKADQ